MPRVLRIINRLILGGPAYHVSYLTRDLAPEFETTLVSGREEDHESGFQEVAAALGVTPRPLPTMRRSIGLVADWKSFREVRALIRELRPDIVHTHASKPGVIGRLAARAESVPVVVHTFHGHVFHSYFGRARTSAILATERALARISTRIVAISPSQRDELIQRFRIAPAEKIELIPLGIDLERFSIDPISRRSRFRERYGLGDDEVAVGSVARLVPIKNHDLFLDAWARVREQARVPVRAFLIGDGPERARLEARVRTAGWGSGPGGVVFTSWLSAVEEVQLGLDISVITSHNEGTPVSLIEAQAASRPVVATAVGGVADTMQDGITGRMVAPGSVEELATALLELVHQPELRTRMGAEGRSFVVATFARNRLAADMTTLYRRLLAEAG